MRLLVVASDRMEFSGILAQTGTRTTYPAAVDWATQVRLGGHDFLLAANGVGAVRAAAAVDAARSFAPEAIVSTGFCGALDARLGIADIVVGNCVKTKAASYPATVLAGLEGVIIHSADHVVQSAAEKRVLAATGAAAVEMEAAGVAGRANSLGLPFYCVRAVSDLAGEDMANDFNQALTPDGHFATIVLLSNAFRSPLARIPELIRLRKRCLRAAQALGDFFAGCRF